MLKWTKVFRHMDRNRWVVDCAWCFSLVKVKWRRPFTSLTPLFELNSVKSLNGNRKNQNQLLASTQPMTSAQRPVQPRSQDLSLGSVLAFIASPFFARFVCPYVMRCLTFSCHCLIVLIKYFAVYKGLCVESTMALEQKGKKQMFAYELDFALPIRHEYHWRDTRTVYRRIMIGILYRNWK